MNLDYNNIQIQELLQVIEVINNERFQIGQIFFPLLHHQISHRHQDLQTTLPNICTILEDSLHNRWLIIQNTFFNTKTYSPISMYVLYSNILDFPLCKLYSNHIFISVYSLPDPEVWHIHNFLESICATWAVPKVLEDHCHIWWVFLTMLVIQEQ